MNIKLGKNLTGVIIIAVMIFASICLRTAEHTIYMATLTALCGIICLINLLQIPVSKWSKLFFNKFNIWLAVLFAMYFFYGNFYDMSFAIEDGFSNSYFFYILLFSIMVQIQFFGKDKEAICNLHTNICLVAFVLIAIYLFFSVDLLNVDTRLGEEGIVSGNSNNLAINIGLISMIFVYEYISKKSVRLILPIAISSIAILLTGSKKGLLILGIEWIYFIFTGTKSKLKGTIYIALFAIFIFILMQLDFLYERLGSRIIDFLGSLGFNIYEAQDSNSTNLRILMYNLGWNAFLDNPVFGGGWFFFSYYTRLGTYSHNNFIELLVTYGLAGFLLYYILPVTILQKLYRLKRVDDFASYLFIVVVMLMIIDVAAVTFSMSILNYYFIYLGYLYCEKQEYQNK